MFTDPQDISNKFNDFIVNLGPKLASNIQNTGKNYYDYLKGVNPSSMYLKPIVEMDIIKIIDKFNSNKGAGNDNIGNFIIKKSSKWNCEASYYAIQLINYNRDCPRKVKNS